MDMKQLMKERYAVKKFDENKKVSEKDLAEIKEMIKLAPTSFGLQPFKVKIISDKETKGKLLPASWNQPQITSCSYLLVFCSDTSVKNRIDDYETMLNKVGFPADKTKGYTDMMRNFEQNTPKDKLSEWAGQQAFIALDHAMLGAISLGIHSCPMGGFDASEYKKILELPENLTPVVLLPIGYPTDEAKPKIRYDDLFF